MMNNAMRETEFLIVGQGLAGSLFAFECFKNNRPFVVIDEQKPLNSSRVAAGMFNPISGKRMTLTWNLDQVMPVLKSTYPALEKLLGINFLHWQSVHQVFGSVKEQNDLTLKMDVHPFADYVTLSVDPLPGITSPFGVFEVNGSGWINTLQLLTTFSEWLNANGCLVQERFVHADLKAVEGGFQYGNVRAQKVVFCEGVAAAQENPFFAKLPFVPAKGEVLTIHCAGLPKSLILKKGVYLVHLGDDTYKVGATSTWTFDTAEPSTSGREELLLKLKEFIQVPFEVVDHMAGVRPTTKDRLPLIGEHETLKGMYLLNGLGTKGVLVGPWLAALLFEHITNGKPIPSALHYLRKK